MKKSTAPKVPPATSADDEQEESVYAVIARAQAEHAAETPRRTSGGFSAIAQRFGLDASEFQKEIDALAADPEHGLKKHKAAAELELWGYFSEYPCNIAGVSVRTMTLQDFAALAVIGSPLLFGGTVEAEDLALFVWRLSPDYTPGESQARAAFFHRTATDFPAAQVLHDVLEYVGLIFKTPPGFGGLGYTPSKLRVPATVLKLAGATGWAESAIMALPLPRIFEYLKQIEREK